MHRSIPNRSFSVIDVGHGSCSIINQPEGTVIIDTGSKNHLIEFLNTEGITEVDLIIITHSDEDHLGGLVGILASNIRVKRIMVNPDGMKQSRAWQDVTVEIESAQKAYGTEYKSAIQQTIEGEYLGNLKLQIDAPTTQLLLRGPGSVDAAGRQITSNTTSVALRVLDESGISIAFIGGDLDQVGLDHLLHNTPDLESEILVFPHHGGRPGSGPPEKFAHMLLDAVKPRTVIFSIGRRKHYNPLPEIVQPFVKAGISVSCTQLSRNCSAQDREDMPGHLYPTYASGKAKHDCCAGTVLVDLDNRGKFKDWQILHSTFVQTIIPDRICV